MSDTARQRKVGPCPQCIDARTVVDRGAYVCSFSCPHGGIPWTNGQTEVDEPEARKKLMQEVDLNVNVLRRLMPMLTPEDRAAIPWRVIEGYCEHCGYETPEGQRCHCQNDE